MAVVEQQLPGVRSVLRGLLVLAAVGVLASAGVAAAAPDTPKAAAPLAAPAAVMALLDARTAATMPPEIADYGIDGDAVDIRLTGPAGPGLDALLAGIDPALVRVHTDAAPPRHQALEGGQRIVGDRTRCTLGFTAGRGAQDWIITAGHCTREADRWEDADGELIGTGATTAPGAVDVGGIPVTSAMQALPDVAGVPVRGTTEAPVGSDVCLYGSTSGKSCGKITARGRTVNFDGQRQTNMVVATVCSAQGDSGGPYLTPDGQAQGVHSGGGGQCTAYFTPIGQALSALGLTLRTT
ncbi:S1 family peptidase [Pseudonocardia sp. WMMC193]|uniref:S1 family peptidase n=1 Tax=Pseudonocardia sp. WMMC193 TaxID=2911965 RepID=UPI001F1D07C0|nr:S1 family peptidase [Pseudonocardia sp. WMMC193]MCF7549206.1 S1 family peptidase [Pseudonocardia sp. WMMC193]